MSDANRGRVKFERGHKRVRTYIAGRLVADTLTPGLVWELPYFPTYYVPLADVRAKLEPTGTTKHSPSRGDGVEYDVVIDDLRRPGAALCYPDSPIPELRDQVRLDWNAMDEWFEEDEPIYVHPRDPYSRVDILGSSRHVRVELDGVTVADSHSPRILFETGLPPRYYLPLTDTRMDLLAPSATVTHCPYKGTAAYFTIRIAGTDHPDLAWIYRTPLPESQKIAGLVCFYNEKLDIYLDGVLQERPRTHFS
ncbi:DUF427 domain-containing protein [Nocardia stercoris]|uniref:DUF427 domain-containing protein n=1 Tax=Nocardia stercoris TaxID=2483361 RepID=A0A3M2KRL2_9NOCA|nr:DUF427 domain-containing protein [Nocardia stercoris]RMI28282.1 DUF427 domain-containing protein [Nocardia stercoris]